MDPKASRETLDHSIMYIFAVALEDGKWHHIKSYTPERASKKSTVELWNKIETFEDPQWTKRYHDPNPKNKSFGGRVVILMKNGDKIEEELDIADAHPNGKRPFSRSHYIDKFQSLTEGIISQKETKKFLKLVQNLKALKPKDVANLNIEILSKKKGKKTEKTGIF